MICGLTLSFGYTQNDDLEKEKLADQFLEQTKMSDLFKNALSTYQEQFFPEEFNIGFWNDIQQKLNQKKTYYQQEIKKALLVHLSTYELTLLTTPPSEKRDSLLNKVNEEQSQKMYELIYDMGRPILKDIVTEITQKLQEKKLYKHNIPLADYARFRLGKFINYYYLNNVPVFTIRKQGQQIEYNKSDRTKTTFAFDWKDTYYNLFITEISPKPKRLYLPFINDSLRYEIYYIKGNTYYYQMKVKGISWFSKAIKLPESIEYADYHVGWTRKEKDSFMEDCVNNKKLKALSKTEAQKACACTRLKLEELYPLYAILPKNLDEKITDMIISCLYRYR
ncbi:hypothetical protein BKI52_05940 [marine bacterium AO1-C]|nr:hypothetical protein BKI52_05940 [marine bacterium AO1-C]